MQPLLTVLIPAYNEQATIGELLRRVWVAPYEKQIVVVDDGSTDATGEILAAWEGRCEVVRLPANRGKGAAIRAGLARATGRFTIVQDADLEYDPQDYPRLIEPLLAGRADVVYGSRYLRSDRAAAAISPLPVGEGPGVRARESPGANPCPPRGRAHSPTRHAAHTAGHSGTSTSHVNLVNSANPSAAPAQAAARQPGRRSQRQNSQHAKSPHEAAARSGVIR
jgi:hypothetical protein